MMKPWFGTSFNPKTMPSLISLNRFSRSFVFFPHVLQQLLLCRKKKNRISCSYSLTYICGQWKCTFPPNFQFLTPSPCSSLLVLHALPIPPTPPRPILNVVCFSGLPFPSLKKRFRKVFEFWNEKSRSEFVCK